MLAAPGRREPGRLLKAISIVAAIAIFVVVSLVALGQAALEFGAGSIIGAAIPLLFVAYLIYTVVRRGYEMRRLATEGVPTTGTVTRKTIYRRTRPQIGYAYQDACGRLHQGTSWVDRSLYDTLEVGGRVEVVYVPDRPGVSGLLEDVKNARRALGLKG